MAFNVNKITTGLNVDECQFDWSLRNYYLIQQNRVLCEKQKVEVEVGKLSQTQSKWLIGIKQISEEYNSVYLRLIEIAGNPSDVHVKVTLDEKGADGSTRKTFFLEQETVVQNDEIVFSNFKLVFNSTDMDFWGPILAENDTFTMSFKIVVTCNINPVVGCVTFEGAAMEKFKSNSAAAMQNNMAILLQNGTFSDVRIICSDGKIIPAHKSILTAQSRVFESMLRPESKFSEGNNGRIEVDDISGKTMELLLHYI